MPAARWFVQTCEDAAADAAAAVADDGWAAWVVDVVNQFSFS